MARDPATASVDAFRRRRMARARAGWCRNRRQAPNGVGRDDAFGEQRQLARWWRLIIEQRADDPVESLAEVQGVPQCRLRLAGMAASGPGARPSTVDAQGARPNAARCRHPPRSARRWFRPGRRGGGPATRRVRSVPARHQRAPAYRRPDHRDPLRPWRVHLTAGAGETGEAHLAAKMSTRGCISTSLRPSCQKGKCEEGIRTTE